MLKAKMRQYWRYAGYLTTWLIFEKPRGLDFSMRAKSTGIVTEGNHGYALTSKRALDNILRGLPIAPSDTLLDVGCGKGGVLCFAARYPFGEVAGIEVEGWLVQIARRNVARLHLGDRVRVYEGNALSFDRYGDFNYFFLFNPFDPEIYDEVVDAIAAATSEMTSRPIWFICYGAASERRIRANGNFELVRDERCPYRGNRIKIWRRPAADPLRGPEGVQIRS